MVRVFVRCAAKKQREIPIVGRAQEEAAGITRASFLMWFSHSAAAPVLAKKDFVIPPNTDLDYKRAVLP